ncbi:hypothetical protein [Nostoc sp.]|uniref:hypothetical protein n=1 Tax=Nostoc sp. TaxID=1180 RepID=UPI002FF9475E
MGRFSAIRDWRFKQATKLERKGIDKFGVGFARFLYVRAACRRQTLRVACFPVGVWHHALIIRVWIKQWDVAREYR